MGFRVLSNLPMKGKMTALESTEEARQMTEKAFEEEAKAKERERGSSYLFKS